MDKSIQDASCHADSGILNGYSGRPILYKCFLPAMPTDLPLTIFIHGFKGFMDWGHFPLVFEKMRQAGIPVLAFNFSHNGTNPDHPVDFVDLEAFGNNNYSKELFDLDVVLSAVQDFSKRHHWGIKTDRIVLLGHSRGGAISILKAAEDSRIAGLITWAAVAAFGSFFSADVLEQWQSEGVIFSYNARTKQQMPLYYQLYEDIAQNKERLHILHAASKINVPWQIVHGTDDQTVPLSAAEQLLDAASSAELFILEDANHTFGGKHPWAEAALPEATAQITDAAISFIKEHYSAGGAAPPPLP